MPKTEPLHENHERRIKALEAAIPGAGVVDHLIAAYHNADHPGLATAERRAGHRAGVRDVAVRLGVYAEFTEKLNEKCRKGKDNAAR